MKIFRSARWFLMALLVVLVPAASHAGVFISVGFAPPALPVYVQPVCPEPGLMWTPGYWAYGDEGYYWVPGAWVPAPYVGALWTPGYWGWSGGLYVFHAGYWGPHVGYYGGVNYGFGYGGIGFAGGGWRGGVFAYNTAVMHVGVGGGWGGRTYVDQTIVNRTTIINNNHVAYSGGPGGINHPPAPEERLAERDQHSAPTSYQTQHENTFRNDHSAYASANGGHPANVALSHPLAAESHPAHPLAAENHPVSMAHPQSEWVNHTAAPMANHPTAGMTQTHPMPQPQARSYASQSSGPGAGKAPPAPHPAPQHNAPAPRAEHEKR